MTFLLLLGCPPAAEAPDPCADPGIICTIAGTGWPGVSEDGLPAAASMLYWPSALRWDVDGRLVIADFNTHRIRVVEADGTLRTIAGNGFHEGSEVGEPATVSSLDNPIDFDFLADGRMVVTPIHEALVRVIDLDDIVQPFAGTGEYGYAGDDGPADEAELSECSAVAASADGTVYIADTENHVVRVVRPDGTIGTLAGTGGIDGYAGDGGPSVEALFSSPSGLALGEGTLYVADTGNHAVRANDLTTGIVTTVAGIGVAGWTGDGGPADAATLNYPQGVVVGPDGALWIADTNNNLVRRVGDDGIIETVVGTGEREWSGDGGAALDATLGFPRAALFDDGGDLYIADMANGAVRRVRGMGR